MWVLGIEVGLLGYAGHATQTKQLHWLSSVFVGILMCKIMDSSSWSFRLSGYPEIVSRVEQMEVHGWTKMLSYNTYRRVHIQKTSMYFLEPLKQLLVKPRLYSDIALLFEADVLGGFQSTVYELTVVVSGLFIKGYPKLDSKQKLEWNNRGFSTFHAIVVAAGSLYLLVVSDLFVDTQDELMIDKTSNLSDTIMGVSFGYFLSDLAMILFQFPTLGGMEYVVHHGLSMYSIIQSLLSGQAQIYILMVLFTESTTPFVNLRWYLDVAGLKNSKLYTYNGVALFFGWLVARIILFVYFFYHMFMHFDQVKKVFPLGFYSLLGVPPVLAMMNLFWFWKIARGMIKTLNKARHSK